MAQVLKEFDMSQLVDIVCVLQFLLNNQKNKNRETSKNVEIVSDINYIFYVLIYI